MDDDRRRLLSRAVKAEDDVQHLRERLAACSREFQQTRERLPVNVHQVRFKAPPAATSNDPLIRLFAATGPPQ